LAVGLEAWIFFAGFFLGAGLRLAIFFDFVCFFFFLVLVAMAGVYHDRLFFIAGKRSVGHRLRAVAAVRFILREVAKLADNL